MNEAHASTFYDGGQKMEKYLSEVFFYDNFMEGPRLVKHLINIPRKGDEVVVNHNVFIVTRVRTRHMDEFTRSQALVNMERVRGAGRDGW